MSTKHLYDSAEGLVLNSLRGVANLNPALRVHAPSKSVYLTTHSTSKRVSVISGGGAGHEPAHASYTGAGMLSACVSGDIFASPSAKQILTTIRLAALVGDSEVPRDVLVIINNYTGDRLNFGLAIEKARVSLPGVNIESVVVADDISLLKKNVEDNKIVGPRGLAGNILVCKLLGALAETGAPLQTIKAFGDAIVRNLRSLGAALDHCHVPGRTKESHAHLDATTYELGLGLHNEAGVSKQELYSSKDVFSEIVGMLVDKGQNKEHARISNSTPERGIVLFVNNLGGMSQLEMGAIVHDLIHRLEEEKLQPRRIYCSSYMTSLNAPGFSVSILDVGAVEKSMSSFNVETNAQYNIDTYELLDTPTEALAWIGARAFWPSKPSACGCNFDDTHALDAGEAYPKAAEPSLANTTSMKIRSSDIIRTIRSACTRVILVSDDLTDFDSIVGDGDCGETFSRGAKAVLKRLEFADRPICPPDTEAVDMVTIIRDIADIVEDTMGGTIGALFAIFFNSLSASLVGSYTSRLTALDSVQERFGRALHDACASLGRYTPAKSGDRTIMDVLIPFCDSMLSGEDFEEALEKARTGAENTRSMRARLGRAVYAVDGRESEPTTGKEASKMAPPDPGAWGVLAILDGIRDGLDSDQTTIPSRVNVARN